MATPFLPGGDTPFCFGVHHPGEKGEAFCNPVDGVKVIFFVLK